jgi:hypothetical protein
MSNTIARAFAITNQKFFHACSLAFTVCERLRLLEYRRRDGNEFLIEISSSLMRGLDPRIQSAVPLVLDGRVKPGHEVRWENVRARLRSRLE